MVTGLARGAGRRWTGEIKGGRLRAGAETVADARDMVSAGERPHNNLA